MSHSRGTEDLLRTLAPRVLGRLARRYGRFDACEDAVQDALLRASERWPTDGVPVDPAAWLTTVATRRLVDELRSNRSRRDREEQTFLATPQSELLAPPDTAFATDTDDSLTQLFLCCHPALSLPSQVALTLRAVGGLTTPQIAAAFLVPEATMAQRISRAKRQLKDRHARFRMPDPEDRNARLTAVSAALYLIFNEGYVSATGPDLTVPLLSDEAIRLTRMLHRSVPDDAEVAGLLALMLLTDARRAGRTTDDGRLVPLAEQDRGRWDRALIAEGTALVTAALPAGRPGPYQLQAAIAAIHDEAASVDDTDWPQILGLYRLIESIAPNPVVTLNATVALAHVSGPHVALDALRALEADPRIAGQHRFFAARAHIAEMAGEPGSAADYLEAARRAPSIAERRHLTARAAQLRTG